MPHLYYAGSSGKILGLKNIFPSPIPLSLPLSPSLAIHLRKLPWPQPHARLLTASNSVSFHPPSSPPFPPPPPFSLNAIHHESHPFLPYQTQEEEAEQARRGPIRSPLLRQQHLLLLQLLRRHPQDRPPPSLLALVRYYTRCRCRLNSTPPPYPLLGRGIDEATLSSYPKPLYSKAKLQTMSKVDKERCSICLADYRDAETLRMLLDCGHLFHVKCVNAWLRLHPTYPVCRTSPLPMPLSTPLPSVAEASTNPPNINVIAYGPSLHPPKSNVSIKDFQVRHISLRNRK